ncbi:mechanosensitive ion channel family protein [Desulfotalea psychrophila]|uniref:Conserved hypothetical membrane protein n=1 Tax=Desulfotalea psychrophila (strain LSv54 / DSM 12343) TaxID=177439 RepID=Q6AMD1_DESPS|nr:mechanosensitive ion channel family protein [Desulfotalea psychrophila]CAG36494.1 conserved hypothetical membrane protein [Desulfotalea psychrophila LSv54]
MPNRSFLCLFVTLFFVSNLFLSVPSSLFAQAIPPSPAPSTQSTEKIQALMAGLSDEQVRAMLITELQNDAAVLPPEKLQRSRGPAIVFGTLLTSLDKTAYSSEKRLQKLIESVPLIIPSLKSTFLKLCPVGTSHGAVINLLWILLFIVTGLVAEKIFNVWITRHYFPPGDAIEEDGHIWTRLSAGVSRQMPGILGVFVLFFVSYLVNILTLGTQLPFVQLVFFSALIGLLFCRIIGMISKIFLSPATSALRILPLQESSARTVHRLIIAITVYIVFSTMFSILIYRLSGDYKAYILLMFLSASLLLLITAVCILVYKNRVKAYILSSEWGYGSGRLGTCRRHFASLWHLFSLLYLFILWILVVNTLGDSSVQSDSAFIFSFFALPIWFVLDKITQWTLHYGIGVLRPEAKDIEPEQLALRQEKDERFQHRVYTIGRLCLFIALMACLASLWNINLPLVEDFSRVIFDSVAVCAVSLVTWRVLSNWIEAKIEESLPKVEETGETEEKDDGDWGAGGASKSRAYTLLPMLRKFIGTILLVMVVMTLLAQLGIDIGPLLAGAGVIGLAIGFGAQKLVADMFSGFFYLLDDAFRVGEYLTAGKVSGTVENISLRNVFLRHHLGMLQIVPHSELGAITNFMRGGIIVKFNLDFPYDVDIDLVRRIIKKVGVAMLADEELGPDFIRPIKSQGVRGITNSVMTIRAKFTAHPGKQFVIRREAYRLITEALAKKGIHYAHRKVIVDVASHEDNMSLKAAGAAAMSSIQNDEEQAAAKASD